MYSSFYAAAQGAGAGTGPDMSGAAGGAGQPEDDVIDGDFKEV